MNFIIWIELEYSDYMIVKLVVEFIYLFYLCVVEDYYKYFN